MRNEGLPHTATVVTLVKVPRSLRPLCGGEERQGGRAKSACCK